MRMLTRATLLAPIAAALLTPGGVFAQETGDKDKSPLPLPADRTVAIDMTEGSWMSLDVSPDGTTIVFTSDRSGGQNVWTMSLDGSDTTQVTKGIWSSSTPTRLTTSATPTASTW